MTITTTARESQESQKGLVVFNRVPTACHLCQKILVDTWVPENEDSRTKLTVLCDKCLPSDHVDKLLEVLKHRIFDFRTNSKYFNTLR